MFASGSPPQKEVFSGREQKNDNKLEFKKKSFKCNTSFIFPTFHGSVFKISIFFFDKIFFLTGNYSNSASRIGFQYLQLNILLKAQEVLLYQMKH